VIIKTGLYISGVRWESRCPKKGRRKQTRQGERGRFNTKDRRKGGWREQKVQFKTQNCNAWLARPLGAGKNDGLCAGRASKWLGKDGLRSREGENEGLGKVKL